jgi:hypothetical protein
MRPLHAGPRWYRARLRQFGPVAGVLPPAVIGLFALVFRSTGSFAWNGVAGLATGVFAAPGLLAMGAPFSDTSTYPLGIVLSIVLWLVVGWVAARRATRNPVATWPDYWRQYAMLLASVWLGVAVGLLVARAQLGDGML